MLFIAALAAGPAPAAAPLGAKSSPKQAAKTSSRTQAKPAPKAVSEKSSKPPAEKIGPALSAIQVIEGIQKKFIERGIRTMTYDETRVTSYEVSRGRRRGMMQVAPNNAMTIRLRYFYAAPDRHGYRFLSDMPDNYWAGSPNQPGAIPMDEKWKEKVLARYDPALAKNAPCRERDCFTLVLVPKKDAPDSLYPMTWYVDTKDFLVMKVIFLIRARDGRFVRSVGDVFYKKYAGFYMPSRSKWRTTVSTLPYVFLLETSMDNYHFDIPLDASVFEEEFPEDWFEKMGEIPLNGP